VSVDVAAVREGHCTAVVSQQGHVYSSQAIENLNVKDIAQTKRLGLEKRGSCDLD